MEHLHDLRDGMIHVRELVVEQQAERLRQRAQERASLAPALDLLVIAAFLSTLIRLQVSRVVSNE